MVWLGSLIAVSLTLAIGAFLWTSRGETGFSPSISPTALYATQLPDTDGKPVALGQWQGKVLLINFWATWCAPCREEIPHLVEAQRRYAGGKVQIIGIAVDKVDEVRSFSMQLGINYPILVDEVQGAALSRRLGNRAGIVPFTVLIDRDGRVASVTAGALTSRQIEEGLRKLI